MVATRDFDRPETLISCGFSGLSLYSHSMHSNAFSLIFVSPVRSCDSDSTSMLYGLSLSFLYQRDKEAVLLWIAGIISLGALYYFSDPQARNNFLQQPVFL